MGIHSGDFDFFLVGDPEIHRELLISGPGASITADMEAAASAGQIGLSPHARRRCCRRGCVGGTAARRPAAALAAGAGRPGGPAAPDRRASTRGRAAAADPGPPARRDRRARAPHDHGRVRAVLRHRRAAHARGAGRGRRGARRRRAQRAAAPAPTTTSPSSRPTSTATAARSCSPRARRAAPTTTRSGCCASRASSSTGPGACRCGSGSTAARSSPATSARPFRRTYSVKGDAINLAARVMGKAAPGQAARHPGVVERSHDRLPHHRAAALHGQGQVACRSGPPRSATSSAPATRSGWTCRWSVGTTRWPCCGGAGRRAGPARAGWWRSSASPGSASPAWSRSC